MRRERDAHRHAMGKCFTDAEIAVKTKLDLELQARENELQRERMLAGMKLNGMTASSAQLSVQLQYALREISRLREESLLKAAAADSPPPETPGDPTVAAANASSCPEVLSYTDAATSAADTPAAGAPSPAATVIHHRTSIVVTTATSVAKAVTPQRGGPPRCAV